MINNKFKTAICKHFEQTGSCKMGTRCHFAHGPQELRSSNEAGPTGFSQGNQMPKRTKPGQMNPGFPSNTGGGNNYKTVQCKYFEKGSCKFDQNCTFAHGDVDVRQGEHQQQSHRPMKTSQHTNAQSNNMNDSGIQNQIAQAQIQTLGSKLESYHAHDTELLQAIRQGIDMIEGGNVQDAASVLYNIMNRPDKRDGDIAAYSKFQSDIQSLGNSLYEQYQSTQRGYGQQQYQGGNSYSQQQQGGYNNYNQMGGYGGQSHGHGHSQGGYGGQESYGKQSYGNYQNYQGGAHQGGYGDNGNQGSFGGHSGHGGHGGYQ